MNPSDYPFTIFYESKCPLCNAEMTNLMLRDRAGLLKFEDVCARGYTPPPGLDTNQLLERIHGRKADGSIVKGVEVFRLAYDAVGLGWLVAPTGWPMLRRLSERAYGFVADNRHRFPRVLVGVLFETAVRRAAEKAARDARCNSTTCNL